MTIIGWIRDLIHPKNFFEAQRPIITVTFFGGLTPFTLVKHGRGVVLQCTTFGFFNSFLHTILFIMCYVISISKQESITGYLVNSEISNLGDILQAATGIGALLMTFFYSIIKRQNLIDAFNSLAGTDRHFEEIGVQISYKTSLLRNCAVVIIQFLIQVTYNATCFSIMISSGLIICGTVWMSFLLPFMMISMITILFVSLINQSKYRFYLLNKILVSLHDKKIEKRILLFSGKKDIIEVEKNQKKFWISSVFPSMQRSTADVINRVASIHSEICDACDCIEEYFKVQMLTLIAISFVICVFDLYYILEAIFTDGAVNSLFSKLQLVTFFFYQGLVHIVGVMKIVYVSSLAARERAKDREGLHTYKVQKAPNCDERQNTVGKSPKC
ncbi:putative gustatory receptor 28a [Ochlerotatus camptorhynchus]|uniref:putative gustatory receptor 28a n=1 Tax=Ochlerotatus camptorhynchus TaxID=644619 RepID=UPI0031DD2290